MEGATRLSRRDLEQLLDLALAVQRCEDAGSLRSEIISGLGALIHPDGVGYTEIDTTSGEAQMWSDPPDAAEQADREAFAEFLHQHPVAGYHDRNGGHHAVQFADFLSLAQLHRLELYNDFYAPLEVDHQLAISVDAPGPVAIPISVHRSRRKFSERDRAVLALLHPHLETAHRQLAARLAARRVLEAVTEARTAALMSLGPGDRIELTTGRALRWLRDYFEAPAAAADRLPSKLATWLDGVRGLRSDDRIAGHDAERLTVDRSGSRLTLRYLPATSPWEEDLLLLEEHRVRPDPAELRRRGLTPRETETLICAADGRTDGEIARGLGISVRTVQKHLQSTYRKLGVISRTAAVACALERPAGTV